jgi:hypothetical protein
VQRLSVGVAASFVVALIGCGATPTAPSDVSRAELASAPTRIVSDGVALTLTAFLTRDKDSFVNTAFGPEYLAQCGPLYKPSRWAMQLAEDPLWHTVKFWNAPRIKFLAHETLEFRYAILPFKYDDHLDEVNTVLDLIVMLRNAYRQ